MKSTKTDLKRQIGKEISDIRWRLNMRQGPFAKAYNAHPPLDLTLTAQDLSRYENGVNTIPADKYVKLLSMAPVKRMVIGD